MRWVGGTSVVTLSNPDCASVSVGETASTTSFLCYDTSSFPSSVRGVQWLGDGGSSSFSITGLSQISEPAAGALGTTAIVAWRDLSGSTSLALEPFVTVLARVTTPMNQTAFAQGPTTRLFFEGSGVRFVELPNLTPGAWVSTATNYQLNPLGAFADGRFLVAWEDGRTTPGTIHWTRIAENGVVETPLGLELAGGAEVGLSLGSVRASGPASATIIYSDSTGQALCGRIGPGLTSDAGAVVAPNGLRAAFNRAGLGLVVRGFSNVTARLIDADCAVRSSDLLLTDAGLFPSIAWDGTSFLTVWESGGVVRARYVSTDGGLGPVFDVGPTNAQARVHLAGGPGMALALWHDSNQIRMARFSADAGLLNPGGVLFPSNSFVSFEPRVVFTGTNWLVSWMDSYAGPSVVTMARRVTLGGVPLDDAGLVISSQPQIPTATLVEGPGQALVLEQFYDSTPSVRNQRARFRRVDLEPPSLALSAVSTDCSSQRLSVFVTSESGVQIQGRAFELDGDVVIANAQTGTSGVALLLFPLAPYQPVAQVTATDNLGNIANIPIALPPTQVCGDGGAGGGTAGGGTAGGGTAAGGTAAGGTAAGVQTMVADAGDSSEQRELRVGFGCHSADKTLLLVMLVPLLRRRRQR